MPRYIDAEPLYDAVEQRYRMSSRIEHRCERDFLDLICDQPTISPDEVRGVGEWEKDSDGLDVCSDCGEIALQRVFIKLPDKIIDLQMIRSKYCPNCGARMKGAEDGTTD